MTRVARLIKEDEKHIYNDFVANCSKGHILQSYEWGQVKSLTGWKPFRLVVEEDGKIVAAISLLKRDVPGIKKSIFYATRGPVQDLKDHSLFMFLMDEVKKLALKENVIFLKMDPDVPTSNDNLRDLLKKTGFVSAEKSGNFEGLQPKFVFRLNIEPSEDELMANFHQKTRYNIRLARKKEVVIKDECTKEDLPVFYKILVATAKRDQFLIRSYEYFDIMWEQLVKNNLAKLFMAYYKGEPIAGTLAFIMGEKAWYIYGASANEHRNKMPNYLLQWTMIKWAKSNGCTLYDFRGVPGNLTEDSPIYGLYRFKKGFDAEYTEFIGEFDLVYSPFYYKAWLLGEPLYSKGIKQFSKIKKKLRGK
ncbi:MAG: methicillin resistance protein [Desulfitibacter sp. BRH_c19]|nr:MAG: methicillin resistance protein [Desulfitibacter sp. BRH_c19]